MTGLDDEKDRNVHVVLHDFMDGRRAEQDDEKVAAVSGIG